MEDLIKALNIFLKYGNINYPTYCEHDILNVMVDPNEVSDEDKAALKKLHFFADEFEPNFISFRYGSG